MRIRVFDGPQCGRRWVPPSITDTFAAPSHHRDHLGQRLEHARRQRQYVDVLLEPTRQVVHVELRPRPRRRDPLGVGDALAHELAARHLRHHLVADRAVEGLQHLRHPPAAVVVAPRLRTELLHQVPRRLHREQQRARRRRPLAQRHRLTAGGATMAAAAARRSRGGAPPPAPHSSLHVRIESARRAPSRALETPKLEPRARPLRLERHSFAEVAERRVDIALVRRPGASRWWPSADGRSGRARVRRAADTRVVDLADRKLEARGGDGVRRRRGRTLRGGGGVGGGARRVARDGEPEVVVVPPLRCALRAAMALSHACIAARRGRAARARRR